MIININITDKRPVVEGSPVIVCNNSDYSIKFTFDADWGVDTYKTARFVYSRGGRVLHEDRGFIGDTVQVPELANVSAVYIGVFEGDLHTSTPAVIPCELSIICKSGEPAAPPPDIDQTLAEQLQRQIGDLNALETEGKTDLVSAINEVLNGGGGADGQTPYIQDGYWWIGETNTNVKAEGTDGYTPVKGTDYFTEADKEEITQSVLNAIPVYNSEVEVV